MKTKYYGHRESSKGYTVADWIWGHRFIDGQHWMEYMLEFLNVLVGFDYELGKGCDQAEGDNPRGYRRLERLGLRRFVFYDEYEKSKDSRDDFAIAQLKHKLVKEKLGGRNVSDKSLETVKQLLRSFSAIEVQRSWFAKSLFPAHESLLFWEALRPKAGTGEGRHDIDPSTPVSSVDKEISLTARNFFRQGW